MLARADSFAGVPQGFRKRLCAALRGVSVRRPASAGAPPEDRLVSKKLYVGNLSLDVGDDQLRDLFAAHGGVASARVAVDRMTGQSRGFGFVEMSEGADEAITALNGSSFNGRNLRVDEARPPEKRVSGGYRR
jgi:RNA recognition motif-containing protein